MTKISKKSPKNLGGRPKGLIRLTCTSHGAYTNPNRLGDLLNAWRKKSPRKARRVDALCTNFLRQLGWSSDSPRFPPEIRDLAVLIVSRGELFMLVLQKDFTRDVYNPITRKIMMQRPADQFRKLEELDENIQNRIKRLGLINKSNKYKSGDKT